MSLLKKASLLESKVVLSLSVILAFRMLGLFMIYPVFSLNANHFPDATPTLIGIALGVYGLTQGLFQLPLSTLSDRLGRKPIIAMGLVLFGLGSVLAACAHSIYMIILGRALQGTGAIGSTLLAYAADITSLENRTKTMAIMGFTIGASFAIAIILGPLLNAWFHLSGLFWMTALFALSGIFILFFATPTLVRPVNNPEESIAKKIKITLLSSELLYLNLGVFVLHAILTASFIVIPHLLKETIGIANDNQWMIYLPILFFVFMVILPIIHLTEKKNHVKLTMMMSICAISACHFLWFFSANTWVSIFALLLFFTGFTVLEALLPSLVSKIAPLNTKGTALGIFSTCQFFGIFIGGLIGGMIQTYWGSNIVNLFSGLVALLWFINIFYMKRLPQFKTELIPLHNRIDEIQARRLCDILYKVPGVLEATVSIQDSIAYLKVDNKIFSKERLHRVTMEFQDTISNAQVLYNS